MSSARKNIETASSLFSEYQEFLGGRGRENRKGETAKEEKLSLNYPVTGPEIGESAGIERSRAFFTTIRLKAAKDDLHGEEGRKEKRGNWSAANFSFPVSPILFFTIKTCLIVRVAVSFAHDYSFNSRISDRSLFCFALGSLSSLQMVDIARSRCTKCLSPSHKSLKPRGESAAW